MSACGGDSGGEPHGAAGSNTGSDNNNETTFASSEEFFDARLAPRLDYCRSCHVPGAVADTDEGRRFMLSKNGGDDYVNVQLSWQRLGRGIESNLILVKNADPAESHDGGQTWPQGSDAYNDMAALFTCWESPARCTLTAGGELAQDLPLLGAPRGRHLWAGYCDGQPDDSPLPTDPRSLVQGDVIRDTSRAVYFNGQWDNCHPQQNPRQSPETCGEWRERVALGRKIMDQDALLGPVMTADAYNRLWQAWGESEMPEDYEHKVMDRYGLAPAPYDNPYPLPDEDPVVTDGGSGQLPWGLVQVRNAEGSYTGEIAMTCAMCHDSQIDTAEGGLGPIRGKGTDNFDFWLLLADIFKTFDPGSLSNGYGAILAGWPASSTRGVSNATSAFELLMALRDFDTLDISPGVKIFSLHSASGDEDTPAWWNISHKARKFFEGGISTDSTRGLMPFLTADAGKNGADIKGYEDEFEGVKAYIDSLEAPEWPGEVDADLARQGAILFHTKDLWAEEGNADAPRPEGGNGSCAACHGVYSPRFAHDPGYLPDPGLIGLASHIVHEDIIGTDPHRARMIMEAPQLRYGWDTLWFGYADMNPDWEAAQAGDPLTEFLNDFETFFAGTPLAGLATRPVGICRWQDHTVGYNAPPLHGVWASAPYFHNGSVPTIRQVLRSQERPTVWRRQLNDNGGFDTTFDGYDMQALGWKHDEMTCGADNPGFPYIECEPGVPVAGEIVGELWGASGNYVWHGYQDIAPITPYQVEQRKVYTTYRFGAGNGGHAFSDVLSDAELAAIMEYLKTL